jgi:hypothetical protein
LPSQAQLHRAPHFFFGRQHVAGVEIQLAEGQPGAGVGRCTLHQVFQLDDGGARFAARFLLARIGQQAVVRGTAAAGGQQQGKTGAIQQWTQARHDGLQAYGMR